MLKFYLGFWKKYRDVLLMSLLPLKIRNAIITSLQRKRANFGSWWFTLILLWAAPGDTQRYQENGTRVGGLYQKGFSCCQLYGWEIAKRGCLIRSCSSLYPDKWIGVYNGICNRGAVTKQGIWKSLEKDRQTAQSFRLCRFHSFCAVGKLSLHSKNWVIWDVLPRIVREIDFDRWHQISHILAGTRMWILFMHR